MHKITLATGALLFSVSASGHFQLVYTPQVNFEKPAELPFRLLFWHPMSNGHVMDMEPPEEFFAVFRGDRIDLKDSLLPITFHGTSNDAKAFSGSARIKRNGDYIFVLIPSPYYEESEDLYIQQIAKTYVNKGEIPSGWQEPVGLPTEIVPLNKPYGVLAGSTFSGIVLSGSEPKPGASIEIEYMAAEPDVASNTPQPRTSKAAHGGTIVAIADDNGVFTFGVPRAGFWGFAALGVGPTVEYQGKELSQDAVLWIRAYELQ